MDASYALSERQKTVVRFWERSHDEDVEWCEPQVKDSGVDTCSSTTLNEEHSHSDKVLRRLPAACLSLPVTDLLDTFTVCFYP